MICSFTPASHWPVPLERQIVTIIFKRGIERHTGGLCGLSRPLRGRSRPTGWRGISPTLVTRRTTFTNFNTVGPQFGVPAFVVLTGFWAESRFDQVTIGKLLQVTRFIAPGRHTYFFWILRVERFKNEFLFIPGAVFTLSRYFG